MIQTDSKRGLTRYFLISVISQFVIISVLSYQLGNTFGIYYAYIAAPLIALEFGFVRFLNVQLSEIAIAYFQEKGKFTNLFTVQQKPNPYLSAAVCITFVVAQCLITLAANTLVSRENAELKAESTTLSTSSDYYELTQIHNRDSVSIENDYKQRLLYFQSKETQLNRKYLSEKQNRIRAVESDVVLAMSKNDLKGEVYFRKRLESVKSEPLPYSRFQDSINDLGLKKAENIALLSHKFTKKTAEIQNKIYEKRDYFRNFGMLKTYSVDMLIVFFVILTIVCTYLDECEKRIIIRLDSKESKSYERVMPKEIDALFDNNLDILSNHGININTTNLRNWSKRKSEKLNKAVSILEKKEYKVIFKDDYPYFYKKTG